MRYFDKERFYEDAARKAKELKEYFQKARNIFLAEGFRLEITESKEYGKIITKYSPGFVTAWGDDGDDYEESYTASAPSFTVTAYFEDFKTTVDLSELKEIVESSSLKPWDGIKRLKQINEKKKRTIELQEKFNFATSNFKEILEVVNVFSFYLDIVWDFFDFMEGTLNFNSEMHRITENVVKKSYEDKIKRPSRFDSYQPSILYDPINNKVCISSYTKLINIAAPIFNLPISDGWIPERLIMSHNHPSGDIEFIHGKKIRGDINMARYSVFSPENKGKSVSNIALSLLEKLSEEELSLHLLVPYGEKTVGAYAGHTYKEKIIKIPKVEKTARQVEQKYIKNMKKFIITKLDGFEIPKDHFRVIDYIMRNNDKCDISKLLRYLVGYRIWGVGSRQTDHIEEFKELFNNPNNNEALDKCMTGLKWFYNP